MLSEQQIQKLLAELLTGDLSKYIRLYNDNFEVKNDVVVFTLEINRNDLEVIQDTNKKIEFALKEILPDIKTNFLMTSHNSLNFNDTKNKKIAKYIIPVASGKGGVGKSTTSINLALALQSLNKIVGILDADIYGPSLPKLTGINIKPKVHEKKLIPQNAFGLQSMSIGFLIPEDSATIWRGPMVMSAINQLLTEVHWQNLDFLIIDMPPGTGDAQLTLAQKVQLTGAIIVSTPQDLSLIDARKGLNMFKKVNVPILGIIENMSYFLCNSCNSKHDIFGHGGARKEAEKLGVSFLGEIPIDINLRTTSDESVPLFAKDPNNSISIIYKKIAKHIVKEIEKKEVVNPKIVIS